MGDGGGRVARHHGRRHTVRLEPARQLHRARHQLEGAPPLRLHLLYDSLRGRTLRGWHGGDRGEDVLLWVDAAPPVQEVVGSYCLGAATCSELLA